MAYTVYNVFLARNFVSGLLSTLKTKT